MVDTNEAADGIRADPSGRFVLRLDPGLHAALRADAARAGLSLNDYCARTLTARTVDSAGPAAPVTSRATSELGADLLGVVAFGSWARGDDTPDSDIDVLIVATHHVPLTRALYRPWDDRPLHWEGRRVAPHFAHLPGPGSDLTGFWAEVAIDGIVLHDPQHRLARRLASLRRRIASGELQLRTAGATTYWVRGA